MPRKVRIKIYKFKELNEDGQATVVNNTITFLLETGIYKHFPCMAKIFRKLNRQNALEFVMQEIWENCREDVMIEINQLEYYKDGSIY